MGIGGFFNGLFGGRNDEVTITREQAQEFRRLVQKELSEIARKRHDLVDKGALEGKTVPVNTLYSTGNSATPEDRAEILKVTEMLLDRHGETMPVNTAHRFVLFLGDGENEEPDVWSEAPGCHERHLRRRDGSPLFPFPRSIVTIQEILDAQAQDAILQEDFRKRFQSLHDRLTAGGTSTVSAVSAMLQETQDMLEEMASIGGLLGQEQEMLEAAEETMMRLLCDAAPNGAEMIQETHRLSCANRLQYLAEVRYKRFPAEEATVALLTEDCETIATVSQISRSYKDFSPSGEEVKAALDAAVLRGLRKSKADKVLAAWKAE